MLTPEGYLPRLADAEVEALLSVFGAVQIDGPKWCGKTWTAEAHAQSETKLDDRRVLPLVRSDPALALMGERPHLVDEWQLVPPVRDEVRRAVDASASKPGSFLLAGSSAPPSARAGKDEPSHQHSGAGRIARLRMHTMSMAELGLSTGEVSFAGLFEGVFSPGVADFGLARYAELLCRGGWPASRFFSLDKARYVPVQYLDSLIEDNACRDGMAPERVRRALASLARNNARGASLKTIGADIMGDGLANEGSARNVAAEYVAYLKRLYVVDELLGWTPPIKARQRLRTKPKRYFTDPSLAVAALGLSPERLLREGQVFGDLFENLAVHELLAYASAFPGPSKPRLHYYRDDKGHEVDVVAELPDGRWGAIEVKLGEDGVEDGAKALLALRRVATGNALARQLEPSFLAVLVGNGAMARRRDDGVCVVPLSMLGA